MDSNDNNINPSPERVVGGSHGDNYSTTKRLIWIGLGLVILLLLWVGIQKMGFLREDQNNVEESGVFSQEYIDALVEDLEKEPFVFMFVPDALETIAIPAPTDTSAVDKEVYDRLVAELKPTATEEEVLNDIGFFLPYDGITYGEYLNEVNTEFDLYQIYDELAQLTLHFNKQYQRPALKDRIDGVRQMAPLQPSVYKNETVSVYPSWRAVEAFMVAEVLARFDDANAQMYRNNSAAMVERGIAYGLYGQSDADAAASLVQQYFTLLDREPVMTPIFTSEPIDN